MTRKINCTKRSPLDPIAEEIVNRMAADIAKRSAEMDPAKDDLVALGIWARVEAVLTARHRSYGNDVKNRGRTWDDMARVTSMASASSAESRYSGRGALRAAETRRRRADGEPPRDPSDRSRRSVLGDDDIDWL